MLWGNKQRIGYSWEAWNVSIFCRHGLLPNALQLVAYLCYFYVNAGMSSRPHNFQSKNYEGEN